MDKFITAEATHGLHPQSKFFEPLKPSKAAAPSTIAFHLIIADPASDSSLTPDWSMPDDLLRVPASITISGFFSHLRQQLPTGPRRSPFSSSSTRRFVDSPVPSFSNSSSSGSSAANRNSAAPGRTPRLGSAKLFLVSGRDGMVLPVVRDDAEWGYRHGYAKVDLLGKTEVEWRFFKELLLAGEGEFKCYVAIEPTESREFNWGRAFFGWKG